MQNIRSVMSFILWFDEVNKVTLPSTMLDLAMKPDEAFRAPLKTTKLAPVTVTTETNRGLTVYTVTPVIYTPQTNRQNRSSLTGAGFPRFAVGLSLIVSLLILETHQVRVGL